jgi:hypothetical protein
MAFVSNVTAPVRAITRPFTLAPVVRVSLTSATMFPSKAVPVPSVAELPTWKYTSSTLPPLISTIDDAEAVVSVLPIWKTNCGSACHCASRVSIPVSCATEEKW